MDTYFPARPETAQRGGGRHFLFSLPSLREGGNMSKTAVLCIASVSILTMLLCIVVPMDADAEGGSFYVDSTADGSGDGSLSNPWNVIDFEKVQTGDTIYLKGTFEELTMTKAVNLVGGFDTLTEPSEEQIGASGDSKDATISKLKVDWYSDDFPDQYSSDPFCISITNLSVTEINGGELGESVSMDYNKTNASLSFTDCVVGSFINLSHDDSSTVGDNVYCLYFDHCTFSANSSDITVAISTEELYHVGITSCRFTGYDTSLSINYTYYTGGADITVDRNSFIVPEGGTVVMLDGYIATSDVVLSNNNVQGGNALLTFAPTFRTGNNPVEIIGNTIESTKYAAYYDVGDSGKLPNVSFMYFNLNTCKDASGNYLEPAVGVSDEKLDPTERAEQGAYAVSETMFKGVSEGGSSWTYDTSTKALVFEGGTIEERSVEDEKDWFAFKDDATSLTMNNVSSVGEYAFANFGALESATIQGTQTFGPRVFDYCDSLVNVQMSDGVTAIGSSFFRGCTSLQTFDMPDTVSSAGSYLFSECVSLTSVELSTSLQTLKYSTFSGCTALESVVIPENIKTIEYGAFKGCGSLESVVAPGVTSISGYSSPFAGCTELKEVVLGEDCSISSANAFEDCPDLETVIKGEESFPVTDEGDVGVYVAKVGETGFDSVQSAVDSIGTSGTVTLVSDITLSSANDVVTIPAGKTITLDMGGMTVTAAEGFSGRYIVNDGELIITGGGTFDGKDVEACRGLVTNNGVLTIENGTFYGNILDTFAFIWNNATATFNGGSYTGAVTMVGTAAGSYTYINGGYYESPWYPAVDNRGYMKITGGTFVNTSCSSCDSENWGYTVRSGLESPGAYLLIDESQEGSVSVTGVQGALSLVGGSADIRGGTFETTACENHPSGSTSYYALYVSPEKGIEVEVTVTGGIFETVYRSAARIGDDNWASTATAVTDIRGGSFISPSNVDAVSENAAGGGNVSIAGGSFSSDVSEYAAPGYAVVPNADGSFGPVQADTSDIIIESENQVVEYFAEGTTVVIPASDGKFDNVTLDLSFGTAGVTVVGTVEGDVTVGYRVIESPADMAFDLYISGVSDANMKVTITVPLVVESGYSVVEDSLYVYSEAGGEIREENAYLSGNSVVIVTDHNTPFHISYDVAYVMPPIWDDDDDYVPPIVPSQTDDSGNDDTTTIVACAAAAVVAALLAAFLIIDRRQ